MKKGVCKSRMRKARGYRVASLMNQSRLGTSKGNAKQSKASGKRDWKINASMAEVVDGRLGMGERITTKVVVWLLLL